MKKLGLIIVFLAFIGFAGPAVSADFAIHGDMSNRFLVHTNHNDWLDARSDSFGVINDNSVNDQYAELKYRFWTEISDNDDMVKGVYAIEVGGIRWGRQGSGKSQGGSFSGDGVNLETRWAYLDFQLPFIERKARARMGLQPFKANSFFWQETATALHFNSNITDSIDYELAWVRSVDKFDDIADTANDNIDNVDSFYARANFKPIDDLKIGLWGLYMKGNPDSATNGTIDQRNYEIKNFADDVRLAVYTLGTDGSAGFGNFFVNWDLMYQGGDIDNADLIEATPGTAADSGAVLSSGDFDVSAYLLHADLGYKAGKAKFTYTFWYASGDDDLDDSDLDAFLAVDVDREDSMTIFEGPFVDDVTYFTERPYMLTNGFVMNKLAFDYQWTENLTVGTAAMYMLTAEDFDYVDGNGNNQSEDEIGVEINGFLKYKLYKNLEFALNAGYLFAGDGMDFFEQG
ncbi:MAG: hypothetical protein KAS40_15270, partial [Desulfobacterales bacterium]|nr:hypothetical protein [Desulfobacterales bacterium]